MYVDAKSLERNEVYESFSAASPLKPLPEASSMRAELVRAEISSLSPEAAQDFQLD